MTTDWLLSESEPEPETFPESEIPAAPEAPAQSSNWVESIPGVIGRLIRRYGWLYGVYTALAGLGFIVIGAVARGVSLSMERSFFGSTGSSPFGSSGMGSSGFTNPVAILGTVIIVIGVVMLIAGVILAVYLKKRGNTK